MAQPGLRRLRGAVDLLVVTILAPALATAAEVEVAVASASAAPAASAPSSSMDSAPPSAGAVTGEEPGGGRKQVWPDGGRVSMAGLGPAAVEVQFVPAPKQPLQRLTVMRPDDGSKTLSTRLDLRPVRLEGPNVSLVTRALNGTVPGPAIGVPPGGLLRVLATNRLQKPLGPPAENNYHHPNTTNLHVHGWHVSPLQPHDDVLRTVVQPGEAWQYTYQLPEDHSPGTYWIHPHAHGSQVLQTGAGAALPLIVLDPPGYLSEQLASMDDSVLMMQELPRALLEKAANTSKDELFRVDRWDWGPDLWLVNGAPEPLVAAAPGRWQRLRFVTDGVSTWLNMEFGSGCDVALLAKDGVYIRDFPRLVPRVMVPPGGRADVVVRCSAGRHEVVSATSPSSVGCKAFVGPLFSIDAADDPQGSVNSKTGSETKEAPARLDEAELDAWAPATRPSYLQDLSGAEPACSCSTSMGIGGNTRWMQGHLFEGVESYLHRSPQNAVIERHLSGIDKHPYHAHNYPFQLQTAPAGGREPYFQVGDWHDTYLNVEDPSAVVRFFTADVFGPQVVHCHLLAHSDQGMIAVELVQGSGASACGCDLLDMEERRPTLLDAGGPAPAESGVTGPALALAAGLMVAGMSALVLGGGAIFVRSLRRDVATSYYAQLPDGPKRGSNEASSSTSPA